MEKKIYEKPLISEVIDLDGELCEIIGETRIRINNADGTRMDGWEITQETDDFDWDDWNYAKKSTIWDDEDED